MNIFKRLPIGILITKDNKVIHSNKAMLKIIGQDNIELLDELDQSLVMDQDSIPAMQNMD